MTMKLAALATVMLALPLSSQEVTDEEQHDDLYVERVTISDPACKKVTADGIGGVLAVAPSFLSDPLWYCTVSWWCHDTSNMNKGTEAGHGTTKDVACRRALTVAENKDAARCRDRRGAGYNDCNCLEETVLSALLATELSQQDE